MCERLENTWTSHAPFVGGKILTRSAARVTATPFQVIHRPSFGTAGPGALGRLERIGAKWTSDLMSKRSAGLSGRIVARGAEGSDSAFICNLSKIGEVDVSLRGPSRDHKQSGAFVFGVSRHTKELKGAESQ